MRTRPTVLFVLVAATCEGAALNNALFYDTRIPQIEFAASEIRKAYAASGASLSEAQLERLTADPSAVKIAIAADSAQSASLAASLGVPTLKGNGSQSYAIRRKAANGITTVAILGADAAGAMYGGLDIAEAIRLGSLDALANSDHAPRIERRGIKFNVPLDARTPSYSDNSDAAQNNIAEMWSLDFWRDFIDEMARHRYNVLSLWNLHPFPSLVKVPEYPDVALDDVKRTLVPMDDTFSHNGNDMVRPDMLAKLETLKKMPIADKIAFWRAVMRYAHDRGIEVYWFTWNIFTFGAEGKYGITAQQDNQKTIDYFRASVRELVLTYPLLDGIGITAGEHMEERKDEFSKEKWLWNAYGRGVVDARKLEPDRRFRMIHRICIQSRTHRSSSLLSLPFQRTIARGSPCATTTSIASGGATRSLHGLLSGICRTRTRWPASIWDRTERYGDASSSAPNPKSRVNSSSASAGIRLCSGAV
jgi:hypothetical protein